MSEQQEVASPRQSQQNQEEVENNVNPVQDDQEDQVQPVQQEEQPNPDEEGEPSQVPQSATEAQNDYQSNEHLSVQKSQQIPTSTKFYNPQHARMLSTGMSSLGQSASTQMMQARNNLKMMAYQEIKLQARLNKLSKEEEAAKKRIRDAQRKANFIAEMQQFKAEKTQMKQMMQKALYDHENESRSIFQQQRNISKMNRSINQQQVFSSNRQQREEIKQQQDKIRQTILNTKIAAQNEKQKKWQENYNHKKKAAVMRDTQKTGSIHSTTKQYKGRIDNVQSEADHIKAHTEKMAQIEAQMLKSLQNTQNQERLMMQKLQDLQKK